MIRSSTTTLAALPAFLLLAACAGEPADTRTDEQVAADTAASLGTGAMAAAPADAADGEAGAQAADGAQADGDAEVAEGDAAPGGDDDASETEVTGS